MQNDSSGPSVAMSLTIHEDFTWLLHIKGKLVTAIVESAPIYLNTYSNVKSLLLYLSKSKKCAGNIDEKFMALEKKGKFMDETGIFVYICFVNINIEYLDHCREFTCCIM